MEIFDKCKWNYTSDSNMVILTGAGISAESGIPTFRTGDDGLWMNYPIEMVAYPRGLRDYRDEVIEFYNKLRDVSNSSKPNDGHRLIAELQSMSNVYLITQNIDELHERGGSTQVAHIHGNIHESICEGDDEHTFTTMIADKASSTCPHCLNLLRPNITLFNEEPQNIPEIYTALDACTHLVLIGTSGEVYPAAGFKEYVKKRWGNKAKVLNINIDVPPDHNVDYFLETSATEGLRILLDATQ
jgi:NAD-dependent deacetylase